MRRFNTVYTIFLSLAFLLNVVPSLTTSANAEPYIALQLGAAISNKESDIKGTGGLAGNTFGDFELKSSFMYGFKTGYFFSSHRWLGVEADFFNSTPDVKRQTVAFSGPGGSGTILLFGTDERVTVWALNLLARYPGEQFQPYGGVGLGIFFFNAADTVPGLNVLAGGRFFLTKNLALFGEYKYNRASTEADTVIIGLGTGRLQFDYSAHILALGAGFHF